MDIIHRLNALASNEHDDLTIGFEAAATPNAGNQRGA